MYAFVFESGVAKLVDNDNNDHMVVSQPFNPTFNGPQAWQDESQAREWMEQNYSAYFQQPVEPDENQGE